MEGSHMPALKRSSSTTLLSARQTTVFGPWNAGIVLWRLRKRIAITWRVEMFLIQHGSIRLCSGLIRSNTSVQYTCAQCKSKMCNRSTDLLNCSRIWCRSCRMKEQMGRKQPSKKMLERAIQTNREGAARQRLLRIVSLPKEVPFTRETVRSQVRRLSVNWVSSDWKAAMQVASQAAQRCTNPRASHYSYYGGRGITFGFISTAIMADWLLKNLGPKPKGKSLDRINTNGHYEPGNLRWATLAEQMLNRNSWRHGT